MMCFSGARALHAALNIRLHCLRRLDGKECYLQVWRVSFTGGERARFASLVYSLFNL